jgi:DedD protein
LDTQLKQRLTGAAILVVLAVVLIPELLTGPKRSPDAVAPATRAAPDGAESAEAPVRWIDLNRKEAAVPAGSPGSPAVAPVGGGSAASVTPVSPPATAAPQTPVAKQGSAASVDTEPAADAAAKGGGAFAVQLGSFSSRQSAERLASDVRRAGFDPSISPVDSGGRRLHRVRVGPVADRVAAEALAARLAASGHRGTVVAQP